MSQITYDYYYFHFLGKISETQRLSGLVKDTQPEWPWWVELAQVLQGEAHAQTYRRAKDRVWVAHKETQDTEEGLAPGHALAETVGTSATALLTILWKLLF